jgi:hypothetical protein
MMQSLPATGDAPPWRRALVPAVLAFTLRMLRIPAAPVFVVLAIAGGASMPYRLLMLRSQNFAIIYMVLASWAMALDGHFLVYSDPARFAVWLSLGAGNVEDSAGVIAGGYGARFVVVAPAARQAGAPAAGEPARGAARRLARRLAAEALNPCRRSPSSLFSEG